VLSVFGYCCTRQTGVALIVGLIVLTTLTFLSLSGMHNAQVEERMAGNFRDRSLTFQGVEAALRDAEAYLQVGGPATVRRFRAGTDRAAIQSGQRGLLESIRLGARLAAGRQTLAGLKKSSRGTLSRCFRPSPQSARVRNSAHCGNRISSA